MGAPAARSPVGSMRPNARIPSPASRNRRPRSRSTAWNAPCSTRIAPTKEDSDDRHEGTSALQPRHGNVAARGGTHAGRRPNTGPDPSEGIERGLGFWAHARGAAPYVESDPGPADAGEIDSLDL